MKTVTIKYGPANALTKQVEDSTTYAQLLSDRSVQATLGYGTNVQALQASRVAINMNSYVQDGAIILLETVANTKGADDDIVVSISYGPANTITKSFPRGTTVGNIRNDANLRATLGFGANSKVLINRYEQPDNAPVQHGDTLMIETVANTKGN